MARPAWSPGGDALAYESEGDIFIVDVNTGEQRAAFENGNAQDGHPSWAPDGDRFAFVSDRDGTRDVYTADINGENAKRLTKMGGAHWPRWTADGLAIVFSASHGGNSDIYMIDTEGGPPQRLTDHPSTDSYPSIFDPAAPAVAPQDTALTQWASLRRGQ